MISPSGLVCRDSHSCNSTTTLSPTLRGPAHVARRRHINVVRHPRVIGNHVKKLAAPLQRADDLCPLPFQDANHHARFLLEPVGAQALRPDIAPHQHAIFVERGAGGLLRNHDFLQPRVVRLQKALALAIDANPARDEVGLARLDVAIPFRRAMTRPDCSSRRSTRCNSCWRRGASRRCRSNSGTLAGA